MADLKISQLTGASTPLAGTEVLPIVQSGSTKKVSVADLTLGRAVASAGGAFSDNFTQGTAGKGVNFTANTPAAGMTSQLLNWYEEGTFTATLTGSTGAPTTPVTTTGYYTRVGRQVTVQFDFQNVNTTGATGGTQVTGLPFSAISGRIYTGAAISVGFGATPGVTQIIGTTVDLVNATTGANIAIPGSAGNYLFASFTYMV